jgi:hypothetical protein
VWAGVLLKTVFDMALILEGRANTTFVDLRDGEVSGATNLAGRVWPASHHRLRQAGA